MEKKVDEGWKQKVEEEKRKSAAEAQNADELPSASFFTHVTTLASHVMISLGEVAHPTTGAKEKRLPEAEFGIDTLAILEEKTKGNLTDDEERYLSSVLTELRMRYVQISQASGPIQP